MARKKKKEKIEDSSQQNLTKFLKWSTYMNFVKELAQQKVQEQTTQKELPQKERLRLKK